MRVTPRRPAHLATSGQLDAAYPFMAEPGLGGRGVYVGRDVYRGSAFCYDPWVLYERGLLTGPSAIVCGQVGRGKSALVKTYLARQAALGRRAVVIDPKGEYGALAEWFGARPVRLVPGGRVRLNPLDSVAGPESRLALLAAVLGAGLGRSLRPAEHTALDLALRGSSGGRPPTLASVASALLQPDAEAARSVAMTRRDLTDAGRDCALELRRLCEGDLRGMFDGRTSGDVDLDAPVVVLDLSALHGSPALGILMVCVAAWLEGALRGGDGTKRIVVIDEGWAVLSNPASAAFLQRSWKLARSYGVQNVLVVHRLSDLTAAADEGSRGRGIAEGLLADSETRIILGQPPGELDAARRLIGLTGVECDHVASLPRGVALWKVGGRSYLVEHRLSPDEVALVDTDAAMRD
ncbi:MAG: ATP-binding protein [Actinomycetota bacterium]